MQIDTQPNPHDKKYKKYEKFSFEGWGDFINFAMIRESAPSSPEYSRHSFYEHPSVEEFTGTKTLQEAYDLSVKGWDEGTAKLKAVQDVVLTRVTSLIEKQDIQYDVTGNDFDMGLFMQGVPECWTRILTQIDDGEGHRVVKLLFNTSVSYTINADVIIAKGATVAALVQALELAGIRVEVTICECSGTSDRWGNVGYEDPICEIFIPIKAADQPLDIDRLTFALSHPATLRRFCFAVVESSEQFIGEYKTTYGVPRSPIVSNADILIDRSLADEPQWTDVESASAWVVKKLREQGVKIEEQNV